MKVILTSTLGGYSEINGVMSPEPFPRKNGFSDRLKAIWRENASVLFICAYPDRYEHNDSILACFKETFPMSGLSASRIDICDNRNPEIIENLGKTDVLIFMGGHVPTQNKFMKKLRLRERLAGCDGIIIAMSAGSMNCADVVYACPELEGEAVDPLYERRIPGLGITDINILPHLQSFRDVRLDGMRVIEDIVFADSAAHEIIGLNDGSYIMIADGKTTVYGEAYVIKDGRQTQICKDDQSVSL